MEHADVAVVGGGPAGSSCAARLAAAGLDVVVVDRARFPRDKPCAGWITRGAVDALGLDLDAYAAGHTLQPIRRFRVGWAFGAGREVDYGEDVSYAIRRCELDSFLLRRSGARLLLGENVSSLRREDGRWIVNDAVEAPLLVGAGGHFCPVARRLRGAREGGGLVIAQEMEVRLSPDQAERCPVAPDRPELDFTKDLSGYGWCVRKGEFLNVGFGRREAPALATDVRRYLRWLVASGRIPDGLPSPLRGHAYRLREGPPQRLVGEGALLVGDAAGLAFAASGEGIYPAIVSGQLAAEVLLEQRGRGGDLRDYPARLTARLGRPAARSFLPGSLRAAAGRLLLGSAWFRRHVVLDRLFLHRQGAQRCVISNAASS
jgi:flavin-dependent dehydrogenase